jgi:hypothetical protein
VGWRAVNRSAIYRLSDTRLGRKKPRLFRLPLGMWAILVTVREGKSEIPSETPLTDSAAPIKLGQQIGADILVGSTIHPTGHYGAASMISRPRKTYR